MKPGEELKVIGGNIRRLRRGAQWTQQELAERAGLSVDFISGIERGVQSASIPSLARVAAALQVDLSALVASGRAPNPASEVQALLDEITGILRVNATPRELEFLRDTLRAALQLRSQ